MIRKPVFDAIRRLLGRGLRQAEVAAIDRAIDESEAPGAILEGEPSPCSVSPVGIALIKRFEGCAKAVAGGLFEAYPDPGTGGAPWTIGWGATGAGIGPGTVWTRAECDARLETDLGRYAREVATALGKAATSQAQFDALVSFHYNTGAIARATLTALHKAGDFTGAAAEFARWNCAGGKVLAGLVKRRQAEAALYESSFPHAPLSEQDPTKSVNAATGDTQMLRMITAAAALALAASSPAFAHKGGHGGGHGGGADHGQFGGDGDDRGHGNDRDRGGDDGRRAMGGGAPGWLRQTRSDSGNDHRWVERRVETRDDRDNDRFEGVRNTGWNGDRGCPPGLAKKHNDCTPPGLAKDRDDRDDGFFDIDPRVRLQSFAYRPAYFGYGDRYADGRYAYRDGFLIAEGARRVMIPLLGGALSVGQIWQPTYATSPLADWQTRYYGIDGPNYRYSDNVVYQVDPKSAAIESVAALLTGSNFVVGQPAPTGYDVYNVPYAYRSQYVDSDQALYRYSDGRIYQIDPATMLVAKAIDAVL